MDHFHNPARLISLCRAWGYDAPSTSAAEKWWSRASVPSDFLPVLIVIAELERGAPVQFVSYIRKGG